MKRLLPPRLAGLLILIAAPLGILAPGSNRLALPWRLAGLLVVIAGLLVSNGAERLFAQLGANINTFGEPNIMVTTGPFSVTRNPMYLGLAIALAGAALTVGSLTAGLAPTLFVVAADRWYIPLEEERMRTRFASEYDDYQSRVPRWIGPLKGRRGGRT